MSEDAGVAMAYGTDGIRSGGGQALTAGGTAEAAAGMLQAVQCPAPSFGLVAGAEAIATALARARDAHAATGYQVHARHVDLDGRAQQTAGTGDGLTTETQGIAASGGPGSISAGMS